jgi:hypothetical protein
MRKDVAVCAFLLLACLRLSSPAAADALLDKDGQLWSGKILSMEDGAISIETDGNTQRILIDRVESFRIERSTAPQPAPVPFDQLLSGQQSLASRIEAIAQSLANLERQLVNVQTGQQAQSDRLLERTLDVNPQSRLSVINAQVTTQQGNTAVVGQVVNQAEVPMSNIQVEVVVYGSAGELGAENGSKSKTGMVEPKLLAPGAIGTFNVQFNGRLMVTNFEVLPRGFSPTGYNSRLSGKNVHSEF